MAKAAAIKIKRRLGTTADVDLRRECVHMALDSAFEPKNYGMSGHFPTNGPAVETVIERARKIYNWITAA